MRARSRASPPPPRYFSLVETEEESRGYSSENSVSKPQSSRSQPVGLCISVAQCNFSYLTPSFSSRWKIGEENPGRSPGDKEKVKRADPPEKRLSLQPRLCFPESAPALSPPSRWNSLTAASRPADTATFLPHVPPETRAREGGERERKPVAVPGPHQASAGPGPVTCGESTPSPGLPALHADRIPPQQLLPARPVRTERRARLPSVAAGPQPLQLVTAGGGDRAGQPAEGGSLSGRGGGGRARRSRGPQGPT